jgi:hypothetical protein
MSVRLLERKDDSLGIGIGVSNGALLNYNAVNKKNGAINGCTTKLVGSEVYMSKGTLSVQGFRLFLAQEEKVADLSKVTVAGTDLQYIAARVTYKAETDDASAEFIVVPASSSLNKTDIQNQINGSYDYPIAQFRKNGITISDFQSLITPIDVVSDEFDYHTIDL